MTRLLFPGSFDPPTFGHMDIIARGSKLADELLVGVAVNESKHSLFTTEERVEMLRELCSSSPNVRVIAIDGLVADTVRTLHVTALLRSIRTVQNYEYEKDLADVNSRLYPDCETVVLFAKPQYASISSTVVRALAPYGKGLESFVPAPVLEKLRNKYSEKDILTFWK